MAETRGMITAVGRKKLCQAHAGITTLSPIARMAWGNGGVDETGQPKETTGNEVGLYNELLAKDIELRECIGEEETTCRYTATLEAGELSGEEISEMGLFDEEGDLVSYCTFMRKGKDANIPQVYDMDEIF